MTPDISWIDGLEKELGTSEEPPSSEHLYIHPYHRFLVGLVEKYRPMVSLELGYWRGVGTHLMRKAAREFGGAAVGIDLNHDPHELLVPGHGAYVRGDSVDPEVVEKVRVFCQGRGGHGSLGLVFQDSSHHYEHSKKEFEIYSAMMNGGIWVCDDITEAFKAPGEERGMVEYFDEIPAKEKRLYPNTLHHGSTIGVAIL